MQLKHLKEGNFYFQIFSSAKEKEQINKWNMQLKIWIKSNEEFPSRVEILKIKD